MATTDRLHMLSSFSDPDSACQLSSLLFTPIYPGLPFLLAREQVRPAGRLTETINDMNEYGWV